MWSTTLGYTWVGKTCFGGSYDRANISDVMNGPMFGINATGSIGIYGSHIAAGFAADIRGGGQLQVSNYGQVAIAALSVEGAGAIPAIEAGFTSEFGFSAIDISDGSRVTGSAGNTSVGALIGTQCFLGLFISNTGAPTLSGTGGDVKVGSSAAQAWNAGSATDATLLARFASF